MGFFKCILVYFRGSCRRDHR